MVEQETKSSRVDRALTVLGRARGPDGRLQPATVRKYARGYGGFEEWCLSMGLKPMPCTSETLAVYAELLLQHGYAESTIEGRLAAIVAEHRKRGELVPDRVPAWYVMRGADPTVRETGGPGYDTPVVRGDALVAVAGVCELDRPGGQRDLCLVTLTRAVLAGEHELVGLDVEHVELVDGVLVVSIRGRELVVEHEHEPWPVLCAPCAVERWLGALAVAGARSGALLRSVDKGDNIGGCGPKAGTTGTGGRLNVRGLERIWHRLVVKAELPVCTLRAVRAGSVWDELAAGGSVEGVLARGPWSSDRVVSQLTRLRERIEGELAG